MYQVLIKTEEAFHVDFEKITKSITDLPDNTELLTTIRHDFRYVVDRSNKCTYEVKRTYLIFSNDGKYCLEISRDGQRLFPDNIIESYSTQEKAQTALEKGASVNDMKWLGIGWFFENEEET
ncbi:MAG: hypothetical protein LBG64_04490 [Pseudomonadales bacterium]|jgi:hypothetical protein|nr:hypothetical protein [Pseudomonadales bacterium]